MVDRSWSALLNALLAGKDLATDDTAWAMDRIMAGEATDAQLAAFLVALRAKGESVAELRGLADAMVAHARPLVVEGQTLDIVGTGGDGAHTINISTMSAIVAAGAGATIVKHGNRAASSSSGTADVLEQLGVRLDLTPEDVAAVGSEVGITFAFAQVFHPAMRFAASARREMGIATAFNVLGPLTNPARPACAAIGVADAAVAPVMAGVLADRGTSAAVFRGGDGLDELTLSAPSAVWWVHDSVVTEHEVAPESVGLKRAPLESLRGGSPEHNAEVVRQVLAGAPGAPRDAVLLNAGMALAVLDAHRVRSGEGGGAFGRYADLTAALAAGVRQAQETIDSGVAAKVIDRWVRATAER